MEPTSDLNHCQEPRVLDPSREQSFRNAGGIVNRNNKWGKPFFYRRIIVASMVGTVSVLYAALLAQVLGTEVLRYRTE